MARGRGGRLRIWAEALEGQATGLRRRGSGEGSNHLPSSSGSSPPGGEDRRAQAPRAEEQGTQPEPAGRWGLTQRARVRPQPEKWERPKWENMSRGTAHLSPGRSPSGGISPDKQKAHWPRTRPSCTQPTSLRISPRNHQRPGSHPPEESKGHPGRGSRGRGQAGGQWARAKATAISRARLERRVCASPEGRAPGSHPVFNRRCALSVAAPTG